MKSYRLIALVLVALFTLNVSATTLNPIKPTDELRTELVDLIGFSYLDDYDENEFAAEVLFTVNSNRELIVLSVDSANDNAEEYLRDRLNYKKVDHMPTKYGEIYLLPVKMLIEE